MVTVLALTVGVVRLMVPGEPGAVVSAASQTIRSGITESPASMATAPSTVTSAAVGTPTLSSSPCLLPGRQLTVAAAPDIAGPVRQLLTNGEFIDVCPVSVVAQDPAAFVAGWQSGSSRPAIWIPDSSVWVDRAVRAGLPASPGGTSIASSPVVFALPATAARNLSVSKPLNIYRLLSSRSTAAPIRIGLPAVDRSMTALAAVVQAEAAVAQQPDARAALAWALRSSPPNLPTGADQLLTRLADTPDLTVPVTEQAVRQHNSTTGAQQVVAVYGSPALSELDYPFTVLSANAESKAAAHRMLTALTSPVGQQLLLNSGFRGPAGHAGTGSTFLPGPSQQPATTSIALTTAVADQTARNVQAINEPSRLLAVIDVSGSMASTVPGTGGATRLDLARQAAIRGLGLYPANSAIGLWTFSRNLTADSDHRELVPIAPLSEVSAGASGRERIAQALASVQINPDGGTGLYDTALAAVRQMRKSWDPARVNTVLLLSDGQNDDVGSISLADLIRTLRHEQDPTRPVAVVAIAFGPDSDVAAMKQISQTTGGATYVAEDPRQIGEIFLDSVGLRLCRPNC